MGFCATYARAKCDLILREHHCTYLSSLHDKVSYRNSSFVEIFFLVTKVRDNTVPGRIRFRFCILGRVKEFLKTLVHYNISFILHKLRKEEI